MHEHRLPGAGAGGNRAGRQDGGGRGERWSFRSGGWERHQQKRSGAGLSR